jgi:nucleoside-diphosphate-sugar epimerase
MRIVVTGATGNLGTALLRRWQGSGHDLVGVARRAPGAEVAELAGQWVGCDLADPDQATGLVRVFRGADAVVHLAWALQPMRERGYQRRVNLAGSTLCIAEAARAGVGQVVVASSVAAYSPGRGVQLVDESWPTDGVPGCGYSQDKAALEAILRDLARDELLAATRLAWVRPALVAQRSAGSELMRLGLPVLLPRRLPRLLPLWGVDRRMGLQVVHADDVADAIARIIDRGARGPFNLVTEPVLRGGDIAAAFGARPVHVPWRLTRALADLAWRTRLGPLDPGWITMAHTIPWVSAARARSLLGWSPQHSGAEVMRELVAGMAEGAGAPTAPLRAHSHVDDVKRLLRQGPVSDRDRT